MNIFVIGCGRWGSLITWYLDRIGHHVTLYGRKSSPKMQSFLATRQNDLLTLPPSVALTTELNDIEGAETVIISVGSQSLRSLLQEPPLQGLRSKTVVLCMKGLEMDTGKRLSQIAGECLDPSNTVAVWLGPGHVQEFYRGIPNCMVIKAMGGSELSAYGLCHLGDYEATVFSPYSHNRQFGEAFIRHQDFHRLAEGYYTVEALMLLSWQYGVELPICRAVHDILYEHAAPQATLQSLLRRGLRAEFDD